MHFFYTSDFEEWDNLLTFVHIQFESQGPCAISNMNIFSLYGSLNLGPSDPEDERIPIYQKTFLGIPKKAMNINFLIRLDQKLGIGRITILHYKAATTLASSQNTTHDRTISIVHQGLHFQRNPKMSTLVLKAASSSKEVLLNFWECCAASKTNKTLATLYEKRKSVVEQQKQKGVSHG